MFNFIVFKTTDVTFLSFHDLCHFLFQRIYERFLDGLLTRLRELRVRLEEKVLLMDFELPMIKVSYRVFGTTPSSRLEGDSEEASRPRRGPKRQRPVSIERQKAKRPRALAMMPSPTLASTPAVATTATKRRKAAPTSRLSRSSRPVTRALQARNTRSGQLF